MDPNLKQTEQNCINDRYKEAGKKNPHYGKARQRATPIYMYLIFHVSTFRIIMGKAIS